MATIESFRLAQPAFSDETTWPDDVIESALCDGDAETGGTRWGAFEDVCSNFKRRGQYLFTAHILASTYPNGAGVGATVAGGSQWATSAKSVGDESVTFNNGNLSTLSTGDAWLASTSFGQQFMRLRKRAGMGALTV